MFKRLFPGRTHRLMLFLLSATVALPAPARAADVVLRGAGNAATAFFDNVDPSGCVLSAVGVFAQEDATLNPPNGPVLSSVVTVLVYRDDGCAGHYFYGDGHADAQTIRIASDLSSAQMDATVSVCDPNFECFDAVIHLTWTATGKPQRQVHNTHYVGPVIIITHSGDTFVPATAVGSVSDGTLNLTPNPAYGPASAFMGKYSVIFINELP